MTLDLPEDFSMREVIEALLSGDHDFTVRDKGGNERPFVLSDVQRLLLTKFLSK